MEKMEKKYYKIYECTLIRKPEVSMFLSSFWISNDVCSRPGFKKYALIYHDSIVFGIYSELPNLSHDCIITDNRSIQNVIRSYVNVLGKTWKTSHKDILNHVLKKKLVLKFFPIEYNLIEPRTYMYNCYLVNGLSTISFTRNNRDLGVIYGNCVQTTGTAEERDFKIRLLNDLYANRESKKIIRSENRKIIYL